MPILISVKWREEEFLIAVATVKRTNGVYSDEVVAPEYQLNRIRSVSACRKLGYILLLLQRLLLDPTILYTYQRESHFDSNRILKTTIHFYAEGRTPALRQFFMSHMRKILNLFILNMYSGKDNS